MLQINELMVQDIKITGQKYPAEEVINVPITWVDHNKPVIFSYVTQQL